MSDVNCEKMEHDRKCWDTINLGDLLLKTSPDGRSSATFSLDGQYRYILTRNLTTLFDSPHPRYLNMLMLNGSKATHLRSDPTVTLQESRTLYLGCTDLIVTNIFAWMATDPAEMKAAADPIGPHNDRFILQGATAAVESGGLVICAWGNHGTHLDRGRQVRELLAAAGIPLHYLMLTADGNPIHPLARGKLRVPIDLQPTRWV